MKKDTFGDKVHKFTREDNVKGGRATSPRKALTSVMNGHLADPNMTPERAYWLACLRDGRFLDLLKELIAVDLSKAGDSEKTRARIADVLVKLLPSKSLNLNVDAFGGVDVQQYERFRDVVFSVVSSEQRELILERSRSVGVVESTRDVLKNIFAELKERKDEDEKEEGGV